eukprot:15331542-Ditylum_brightwellii.AAC.1
MVEIISYAPTWRGKRERPTAMFATPINGAVGQRSKEEASPYWLGEKLDYNEYMPFTFCTDTFSTCRLAMTNYGTNTTAVDDESFSFLVVCTTSGGPFLPGVVSFEAITLNNFFQDPWFSVIQECNEVGEYVKVTMDEDDAVFQGSIPPMVILNARVDDEDYPDSVREVSLYVDKTVELSGCEFI